MGGCLLTDNFNWDAQMLAYQSRPPDPVLRGDWRERGSSGSARWLPATLIPTSTATIVGMIGPPSSYDG